MPYFSEYQEVDVELNIDVDEFYREMTRSERKEMYQLLLEGGYVTGLEDPSGRSSWEFDEAIIKLKSNYHALTNEETDLIIKLAKRF
jgi:hypothetical protein